MDENGNITAFPMKDPDEDSCQSQRKKMSRFRRIIRSREFKAWVALKIFGILLLVLAYYLTHHFVRKQLAYETEDGQSLAAPALGVPFQPATKESNVPRFDDAPVRVRTKSGLVEGRRQWLMGKSVHKFLGIPYAKPPVGELRFKKPVPIESWGEKIRLATRWPVACLQSESKMAEAMPLHFLTSKMSEDCLYLNIWSPDIK